MPLFAYQRQGVAFLKGHNGRALLADRMGLGKTIQTIAWLRHRRSARPVVVVCPTSVRLNWQRKIKAWLGKRLICRSQPRPTPAAMPASPLSSSIMTSCLTGSIGCASLNRRVVVVDKAHYIKSNAAMRTKAVKALVKGVPHLIGLTRTPIVNRPVKAFNIIKLIDKTAIPNWLAYTRRYCAPKFNGFAWTFNGATKTKDYTTSWSARSCCAAIRSMS